MTKLTSLILVAGLGGVAHANAFLLNEFDAKAVGRANASAATDVDPSSIYYNVGGLSAEEGTSVQIGASLIDPNASFTPTGGTKTDSTTSAQAVPGFFFSTRVHPMVAVGFGFYTPFGLALSWPASSPQADVVRNIQLHTFFLTPAVGVNLGSFLPGLTVGGGLDLVPATVELTQDIFFGSETGSAHLGANAFGVGGRLGVMYRPSMAPRLSLGVMWRSKITEDFSGTGNFNAPAEFRPQLPPDGDISTSINLPQSVTGGAAYRPVDDLEIEANVVWTAWSTFKQLAIKTPSPTGMGTATITVPENYSDTTSLRLGVQYAFPHLGLTVRGGYIYDPTPIPATTLTAQLPDVNRNDLTVGGSYALGKYTVHGGLLWVLPTSRETATQLYMPVNKGSFDVSAFVASVTLQARFE